MIMSIGKNLRYHRNRLELTLGKLSELSGVDVGTISALELRDSSRSKYFSPLAKAMGMSVEQLEDDSRGHESQEIAQDRAPYLADVPAIKPPTERERWMRDLNALADQLDTLHLGMLIKTARDLVAEQPAKQTHKSSQ